MVIDLGTGRYLLPAAVRELGLRRDMGGGRGVRAAVRLGPAGGAAPASPGTQGACVPPCDRAPVRLPSTVRETRGPP